MSARAMRGGSKPLKVDAISDRIVLPPNFASERKSLGTVRHMMDFDQTRPMKPWFERKRDIEIELWLRRLYDLSRSEEIDAAIHLVLDTLDDLLYARNTARCDEILLRVDVEQLAADLMVALLAGTLRARELFTHRDDFLRRVEARLRGTVPDEANELLDGLR